MGVGASSFSSVAYPEDFIQGELAQLGSHGGLGKLSDGILGILHPVTSLEASEERNREINELLPGQAEGPDPPSRGKALTV